MLIGRLGGDGGRGRRWRKGRERGTGEICTIQAGKKLPCQLCELAIPSGGVSAPGLANSRACTLEPVCNHTRCIIFTIFQRPSL